MPSLHCRIFSERGAKWTGRSGERWRSSPFWSPDLCWASLHLKVFRVAYSTRARELSGQLSRVAIVQGKVGRSGGNGRQSPRFERSASEEAKGGTGG